MRGKIEGLPSSSEQPRRQSSDISGVYGPASDITDLANGGSDGMRTRIGHSVTSYKLDLRRHEAIHNVNVSLIVFVDAPHYQKKTSYFDEANRSNPH